MTSGKSFNCSIGILSIFFLFFQIANIHAQQSWAHILGGSNLDSASVGQQTSDGGYVIAGYTRSFGAGLEDMWILKLDAGGNANWQKSYGGSGSDIANSMRQTSDGGYIVAGSTRSFSAGADDMWILRLDSFGNVVWQKAFGGTSSESAYSVQQTSDGGFIVAGRTYSVGAGLADVWVIKLNSFGAITWQKVYGGPANDWAYSIYQTTTVDMPLQAIQNHMVPAWLMHGF